jgi:HSP20 family protein
MLLPSFFEKNFVDNFYDDVFDFGFPFKQMRKNNRLMNTDVKDLGKEYQLDIELPGYDKKDIHLELSNGYLTIHGGREEIKDEKNEDGKYVRRERYVGKCNRSFYVGDYLKEEDVRASFENGVLKIVIPKNDGSKEIEEKKSIPIE